MSLFVTCGRGIEPFLAEELVELGLKDITPSFCGVHVKDSSMEVIYAINYRSRLASRVLLPILEFRCRDRDELYKYTQKINWHNYFNHNQTVAIDANVNHPQLRNSLFAAQVVKDALCDQLRETHGFRPTIDLINPAIQLNLFIDKEHATLSFDTSGPPLHKRGYRREVGVAPLQEALAAALLRISGYQGHEIIIDPCCGSGTLLIEAALIATKTPPGFWRKKWGFLQHPDFSEESWLNLKNEANKLIRPLRAGILWGCERDPEVARFCRTNLEAVGFAQEIEIYCTDFAKLPKADYQFLITNPPHGKRLGFDENLTSLYRALGDFMKNKMAKPARGFVFTTDNTLGKQVGLASKRRHIISCSGMDARLLEFDLY